MVASCTPCDASDTVSLSGHLVALMPWRKPSRSACGTFTRNGRMASFSAARPLLREAAVAVVMGFSLGGVLGSWARVVVGAWPKPAANRAAVQAARTRRRACFPLVRIIAASFVKSRLNRELRLRSRPDRPPVRRPLGLAHSQALRVDTPAV